MPAMLGKPSRRDRKHLEERGKTAEATVLEIAEKGMAVTNGAEGVISNTELVLKTHLRVEPLGEPAFEVEKRFRYPQLSVPSAGQKVVVRYDPEDHENVDIDREQTVALAFAPLRAMTAQTNEMTSRLGNMNDLLATVREAQAASGGDREKLAEALRAKLGAQGVVVESADVAGPAAGDDPTISALERLAALHASGALTDAEFAAQKARVLGEQQT
jgi:hypothetical protein